MAAQQPLQKTQHNQPITDRPAPERVEPKAASGVPPGLIEAISGDPRRLMPKHIHYLQRTVGNRAVQRLLAPVRQQAASSPMIPAKLKVGPVRDQYEQEADQVAAQVMRQPRSLPLPAGKNPQSSHGQADKVSMRRKVLRRKTGEQEGAGLDGGPVDTQVESSIRRASGGGKPLDGKVRTHMEQRIGADFRGVKVHTDGKADQLNRSLNARAFTTGQDIFFRKGAYNAGNAEGQKLIAHELTHVVQQSGAHSGGAGVRRQVSKTAGPVIQRALYIGGAEYELEAGDNDEDILVQPEQRELLDVADRSYRVVKGGHQVQHNKQTWSRIKAEIPGYQQLDRSSKKGIKDRFKKWIDREEEVDYKKGKKLPGGLTTEMVKIGLGKKSENRRYKNWKDAATALVGEQRAKKNKKREKELAKRVSKQKDFRDDLASVLTKVYAWVEAEIVPTKADFWQALQDDRNKKFRWVYGNANMKSRLENPVSNKVSSNFAIVHDVMFFASRSAGATAGRKADIFGEARGIPSKRAHIHMPGEDARTAYVGAGAFEKEGQHALIEENLAVKAARARNLPMGAGPSNTTFALMNFASSVGLTGQEKEALAWAAFIYWNKKFKQVEATRHTFHEIMDVANLATDGDVRYDMDADNPYNVAYGAKDKNARAWAKQAAPADQDFTTLNGFTFPSAAITSLRANLDFTDDFNLAEVEQMTVQDLFELASVLKRKPQDVFNAHHDAREELGKIEFDCGLTLSRTDIQNLAADLNFRRYFSKATLDKLSDVSSTDGPQLNALAKRLRITKKALSTALVKLYERYEMEEKRAKRKAEKKARKEKAKKKAAIRAAKEKAAKKKADKGKEPELPVASKTVEKEESQPAAEDVVLDSGFVLGKNRIEALRRTDLEFDISFPSAELVVLTEALGKMQQSDVPLILKALGLASENQMMRVVLGSLQAKTRAKSGDFQLPNGILVKRKQMEDLKGNGLNFAAVFKAADFNGISERLHDQIAWKFAVELGVEMHTVMLRLGSVLYGDVGKSSAPKEQPSPPKKEQISPPKTVSVSPTIPKPPSSGESEGLPVKGQLYRTDQPLDVIDNRNRNRQVPAGVDFIIVRVIGADQIEIEAAPVRGNINANIRGTVTAEQIQESAHLTEKT
jgi:hypothetical protein